MPRRKAPTLAPIPPLDSAGRDRERPRTEIPRDLNYAELTEFIKGRILYRLWEEANGQGPDTNASSRVRALELILKLFEGKTLEQQRVEEETDEFRLDLGNVSPEERAILEKHFAPLLENT